MDETGWPIDVRIGRHTSAVLQTMDSWTEENPEKGLACLNIPRYAEVIDNRVGYYLRDPTESHTKQVFYE